MMDEGRLEMEMGYGWQGQLAVSGSSWQWQGAGRPSGNRKQLTVTVGEVILRT